MKILFKPWPSKKLQNCKCNFIEQISRKLFQIFKWSWFFYNKLGQRNQRGQRGQRRGQRGQNRNSRKGKHPKRRGHSKRKQWRFSDTLKNRLWRHSSIFQVVKFKYRIKDVTKHNTKRSVTDRHVASQLSVSQHFKFCNKY